MSCLGSLNSTNKIAKCEIKKINYNRKLFDLFA